MSSRRKAKVAKKEAASTPKTTPSWRREFPFKIEEVGLKPGESEEEVIARIIHNSHANYKCPECGGHEHITEDDEYDASTLICASCGDRLDIVVPQFTDKSRKYIVGYSFLELTGNPSDPFKMHYIGYTPGE